MLFLVTAIPLTALVPASLPGGARAQAPRAAVTEGAASAEQAPTAPAALPPLPLVPHWSQLLHSPGERSPGAAGWGLALAPPLLRRSTLRAAYVSLVRLPTLDRVGRFAHVDLSMSGLSTGPELERFISEPPREGYSHAQELTPGWSVWYSLSRDLALGVATGARFLLSDQSEPVVDPFTSEARVAVFLP